MPVYCYQLAIALLISEGGEEMEEAKAILAGFKVIVDLYAQLKKTLRIGRGKK